jgi:hypothetical protein
VSRETFTVTYGAHGEMRLEPQQIVLSDSEAEELYRYTRNDYINPNTYPVLYQFVSRLTARFAPRA